MRRDAKGRFVKQHPVSQEMVKEICSADKVEQVLEKLHAMALAGDKGAGDLYLAYAVGKPVPSAKGQGSSGDLTWKQAVEQILYRGKPRPSTD